MRRLTRRCSSTAASDTLHAACREAIVKGGTTTEQIASGCVWSSPIADVRGDVHFAPRRPQFRNADVRIATTDKTWSCGRRPVDASASRFFRAASIYGMEMPGALSQAQAPN